jgi:S1-C subfamily serine protease
MISRKIKLLVIFSGLLLAGVAVRQTVATHLNDDANSNIRAITVKIFDEQGAIGSGFIWQATNNLKRVVTNQHVIAAGKKSFAIQTADGKVYAATVTTPPSWKNLDLAALEFESRLSYPIAKVDGVKRPQVGDAVIAAGFPSGTNRRPTTVVFATGTITHVLTKPLAEGYQVGYSSNVTKGMSGGPLVNQQGELIGINGIHSQPLWEAGVNYDDGSTVKEPLLSEISRASWAILAQRLVP